MSSVYFTKLITFLGRRVRVLSQNENGPCPLLALANVMLLRGTIFIHQDTVSIALEELVEVSDAMKNVFDI